VGADAACRGLRAFTVENRTRLLSATREATAWADVASASHGDVKPFRSHKAGRTGRTLPADDHGPRRLRGGVSTTSMSPRSVVGPLQAKRPPRHVARGSRARCRVGRPASRRRGDHPRQGTRCGRDQRVHGNPVTLVTPTVRSLALNLSRDRQRWAANGTANRCHEAHRPNAGTEGHAR
jgi:hypothetical protein